MKKSSRAALVYIFALIFMHKALLWAGDPPIILHIQPLKQTAKVGDKVSWYAMAEGHGTLEYQWAVNGKPIEGATSNLLELESVKSTSQGFYTCTVRSEYGEQSSDRLSLTIRPTAVANAGTNRTKKNAVTNSPSLGAAR
jgi:Immunoglobulin I-set domain